MILDVASGEVATLVKADDSIGLADEECGVVPSWSPDGTTIAWAGCEHIPTDLYVIEADGTNLSKLPDTSGSSDPAWRPT
jgi:Tol biopolymer transport system component